MLIAHTNGFWQVLGGIDGATSDRGGGDTVMEYQSYIGKVEFDDEEGIFHGEIINTRDAVTFQGQSVTELTKAFHESVDDFLEFCKQRGEAPDKPFSGQFVTRISPDASSPSECCCCDFRQKPECRGGRTASECC